MFVILIFITSTALVSCQDNPTSLVPLQNSTTAAPVVSTSGSTTPVLPTTTTVRPAINNSTNTLLDKPGQKPPVQNASTSEKPLVGEAKEGGEDRNPVFSFGFFHKISIGDKCKTTEDCKIKEAFCVDGTCQCSSEYVATSNKKGCLIKPRLLLDDCLETIQCEIGLNSTGLVACIAFKCMCSLDAYVNGGRCYKRQVLGESCKVNEECVIPYSACIQNVCACRESMEPNEYDTRCVVMKAIPAVGDNCTNDHACNRFGELYRCEDGVCKCKPGYHFSGSECVTEKRLGDKCEKSSDCTIDEMREKKGIRECRNNFCSCVQGYTADRVIDTCKSGASSFSFSIFHLSMIFLLYFVYN